MSQNVIHVAFSFDKNYYRQAVVAISSLLDYGKGQVYHIYCLVCSDVTGREQQEIKRELLKKSPETTIEFIDTDLLFVGSHECRGISRATYARLMLHELLPIDKVIYSDVDVVFQTDLSEINDIDISPYHMATNRDVVLNTDARRADFEREFPYWVTDLPKEKIGKDYRNAGFLIINLKKMRDSNLNDKILELSRRQYNFQDQDIINVLFLENREALLILSPSYCYLPGRNYRRAMKEDIITSEQFNELAFPKIIHYAGKKPWDDKRVQGGEIWWNYVRKRTPYYSYFTKRLKKIKWYNRLLKLFNK